MGDWLSRRRIFPMYQKIKDTNHPTAFLATICIVKLHVVTMHWVMSPYHICQETWHQRYNYGSSHDWIFSIQLPKDPKDQWSIISGMVSTIVYFAMSVAVQNPFVIRMAVKGCISPFHPYGHWTINCGVTIGVRPGICNGLLGRTLKLS